MNNQEAFNKVCAHLKKQNKRSRDEEDYGCCYAGAGGLACAVGCLLPRELGEALDSFANDTSWNGVRGAAARGLTEAEEAVELLSGVDDVLLSDLQTAHDNCDDLGDEDYDFWGDCSRLLRNVAKKHGLELPPELQS